MGYIGNFLRLGNWIQDWDHGDLSPYYQVDGLVRSGDYLEVSYRGSSVKSCSLDEDNFIKLTFSWLLGFEFISNPYNDTYFYVLDNGDRFELDVRVCSSSVNAIEHLEVAWRGFEIKYVHELQNLFYALYKEELCLVTKS